MNRYCSACISEKSRAGEKLTINGHATVRRAITTIKATPLCGEHAAEAAELLGFKVAKFEVTK